MEVQVPDCEVHSELSVSEDGAVLLIVDVQVDFVREDGALYNPAAEETIGIIADLQERARRHGLPVPYTRDTHTPDDPEFSVWGEHCVKGSEGWKIVDPLRPKDAELVFDKFRYDGFYGTSLDHELTVRDRDTLIVAGTVANICVHHTAASAGLRYYDVVHPVDGISALTEFDRQAALRQAAFLFQAALVPGEGLSFT